MAAGGRRAACGTGGRPYRNLSQIQLDRLFR